MADPILMTGGRSHADHHSRMCMVLTGPNWESIQDWCQFAATHYVEVVQVHGGVQSTTLTHVCGVHIEPVRAMAGFVRDRPTGGAS